MKILIFYPEESGKTFFAKEFLLSGEDEFKILNVTSSFDTYKPFNAEYIKNDFLTLLEFLIFSKRHKNVLVEISKEYYIWFKEQLQKYDIESFFNYFDYVCVVIDKKIKHQLKSEEVFSFIKDNNLESKLKLVLNRGEKHHFKKIFETLNKYELNPEIIYIPEFDEEAIEGVYLNGYTMIQFANSDKNYAELASEALEKGKTEEASKYVILESWKMIAKNIKKIKKTSPPSLKSNEKKL
ncbi:hypothetical protein [Caminibacter pacificus]|uniref:Uncharacterized protein n=1 Tax=Caminibacter pacificus TaxID=1424653 RepID=A0AAJ4RAP1_9BACT|nr:hypothetical protein [Caminibacter pacificus]QDD68134.1 hypothetical protein C6V80_09785 [Caminibacter pacificus]ROR38752.1 hypothetical protein EDC58_1967 [Caminibacter pacificus]